MVTVKSLGQIGTWKLTQILFIQLAFIWLNQFLENIYSEDLATPHLFLPQPCSGIKLMANEVIVLPLRKWMVFDIGSLTSFATTIFKGTILILNFLNGYNTVSNKSKNLLLLMKRLYNIFKIMMANDPMLY